jgi:hypothetical protein
MANGTDAQSAVLENDLWNHDDAVILGASLREDGIFLCQDTRLRNRSPVLIDNPNDHGISFRRD